MKQTFRWALVRLSFVLNLSTLVAVCLWVHYKGGTRYLHSRLGSAVSSVVNSNSFGGLCARLRSPVQRFTVSGSKAFMIMPDKVDHSKPVPWVWFAVTLMESTPHESHEWMFRRLLDRGVAIAGIDVGESCDKETFGKRYSAFFGEVRLRFHLSGRPCLLAQSRGGLTLYNWAAENPDRVACIAGIYTVGDLRSFPGLAKAGVSIGLSEQELNFRLSEFNPVDRLSPLARANVPILHIHGDHDFLVPLELNSGELARRYHSLGGEMKVIVVEGKGHDLSRDFFQSQELVDFILKHLLQDANPIPVESGARTSDVPLKMAEGSR